MISANRSRRSRRLLKTAERTEVRGGSSPSQSVVLTSPGRLDCLRYSIPNRLDSHTTPAAQRRSCGRSVVLRHCAKHRRTGKTSR
jgi:hypothetical protein